MSGGAALASLRIDEGDLALTLLPELERSFSVSLGRDLRHIVTVGDLHGLMCGIRTRERWSGEGLGCSTQMAFYRLRTMLSRYGLDPRSHPDDALLGLIRLPAPRRFKAAFERETGLLLPTLSVGWRSMIGFLLVAGSYPLAAGIGFMSWNIWFALAGVAVAVLVLRRDPGEWTGRYGSLRVLATATAALNYRAFVSIGACNDEAAVWRVIVNLLAALGVEADRIRAEARLLS